MKQVEKKMKSRRLRRGVLAVALLCCLVLTQMQTAWAEEMSETPQQEESAGEEGGGRESIPEESSNAESIAEENSESESVQEENGEKESIPEESNKTESIAEASGGQESVPEESITEESGEPEKAGQEDVPEIKEPETSQETNETDATEEQTVEETSDGEEPVSEETGSTKEVDRYIYQYDVYIHIGWTKHILYTDGTMEEIYLTEQPDFNDSNIRSISITNTGGESLIIEGDIAVGLNIDCGESNIGDIIINGNVSELSYSNVRADGISANVTILGNVGYISIPDTYKGTTRIEGIVSGGMKLTQDKEGSLETKELAKINPCSAGEFYIENGVWGDRISYRGLGEPDPNKTIESYTYGYYGEWYQDVLYTDGSNEHLVLDTQPDLSDAGKVNIRMDYNGDDSLTIEGNLDELDVFGENGGDIRVNGNVSKLRYFYYGQNRVNVFITGDVNHVEISDSYQGTTKIEGKVSGGTIWRFSDNGQILTADEIKCCDRGEFYIENGVWNETIFSKGEEEPNPNKEIEYYIYSYNNGWYKNIYYTDGSNEDFSFYEQPNLDDSAAEYVSIYDIGENPLIIEGNIAIELAIHSDDGNIKVNGNISRLCDGIGTGRWNLTVSGNVDDVEISDSFAGTIKIEGIVADGEKVHWDENDDGNSWTMRSLARIKPCAAGTFIIENGVWSDSIEFFEREIAEYTYYYDSGEWGKAIDYTDGTYEWIELEEMPEFQKSDQVFIQRTAEPLTLAGDFSFLIIAGCSAPVTVSGNIAHIVLGSPNPKNSIFGDILIANSVEYIDISGEGIGNITVNGNVDTLKVGAYWKNFGVTIHGANADLTVKGNVREISVIEEFKGNVSIEGTVAFGAVEYVEDPMPEDEFTCKRGLKNRIESVPAGQFRITNGVWSSGIGLKNPVKVFFQKNRLSIPENLANLLSTPKLIGDAAEALRKLVKGVEKLCQVFEISLYVNEEQRHTGFGSLTIDFEVGKEFAGQEAIIYHLHEDGTVTDHKSAVGENGIVSVSVTDLSAFMIVIPEAEEATDPSTPPSSDPSAPNSPSTEPTSPEAPETKPLTPVPSPGQDDRYDSVPNTGKSLFPSVLTAVGMLGLAACCMGKRQKKEKEA